MAFIRDDIHRHAFEPKPKNNFIVMLRILNRYVSIVAKDFVVVQ
jgi:hypothetical protein